MCMRSPSGDGGAGAARAAEEARQARITQGTADVNNTFSKFDDPYYGGVSKSYADYYTPQVDDQYQDARRKLVLNLGRSGIVNSKAGARQIGDLDEAYQRERTGIADRSVSAGAQARSDVENARSQVLQQLSASADPSSAVAAASARANALATPPSFSPLGNLFAQFAQMGANHILASAEPSRYRSSGLFPEPRSSMGTGRVING